VSWPLVKLGVVCKLVNGDRGTNYPSKDSILSHGIPFINAGNLTEDHSIVCSGANYISEERYDLLSNGKIQFGDILFCLRGSLGKFAVVDSSVPKGAIASSLVIIRPDKSICEDYLKNYLRSTLCAREISRFENGAAQPNLSAKDLREFEIPLPLLPEQKRIAAILDKADAIRCKRQQAIQLADDFLRAVFLDMFGDPATNPKGWPVYKMSEVIDFKGGSQPPKETFEYEEKEGYIRLVQIRDFRTDKFKTYIPEHLSRRRFEIDDVMVGRYGPPVFQILRGLSGSYNVALMKAVPKDGVTKDFVYRLLQLPTYQDAVISNSERTAGQTGVNLNLLNSLDVPLPPLEVQWSISTKIRKSEFLLDKLKLDLMSAERLYSSISQSAFSGKL
jgi:type I restriction enzyme S subunit